MTKTEEEFLQQRCGVVTHATVVVGEKGQVVIPKTVRDELGIRPGDGLLCGSKGGLAVGFIKPEALPLMPVCEDTDVNLRFSATVGDRGQVVIPKSIRDALGLVPGDLLLSVVKLGAAVGMVKVQNLPRMMEYMRRELADSAGKPCVAAPKRSSTSR